MSTSIDLEITQGEKFVYSGTAVDAAGAIINLSGYVLSGYVRHKYSDTGILLNLAPYQVSSGVSGQYAISVGATSTANLPVMKGLYDIEARYTGDIDNVIKIARGAVSVFPEVTY